MPLSNKTPIDYSQGLPKPAAIIMLTGLVETISPSGAVSLEALLQQLPHVANWLDVNTDTMTNLVKENL